MKCSISSSPPRIPAPSTPKPTQSDLGNVASEASFCFLFSCLPQRPILISVPFNPTTMHIQKATYVRWHRLPFPLACLDDQFFSRSPPSSKNLHKGPIKPYQKKCIVRRIASNASASCSGLTRRLGYFSFPSESKESAQRPHKATSKRESEWKLSRLSNCYHTKVHRL